MTMPSRDSERQDQSEIVHAYPPGDVALAPCCRRLIVELPAGDWLTTDAAAVTCTGSSATARESVTDEPSEADYALIKRWVRGGTVSTDRLADALERAASWLRR